MSLIILIGLGVLIALSCYLLLVVRKLSTPRENEAAESVPDSPSAKSATQEGAEVIPITRPRRPEIAEIRIPRSDLVLASIEPFERAPEEPAGRPLAWVAAVLGSVIEHAPAAEGAIRGVGGLRVTFSKETMRGLRSGSMSLIQRSGGSLVPAARGSAGQIVELGTVVGGAATLASVGPVMVLAAGAVAAAYAQQQWLENALTAMDSKLTAVLERLQDADHGRVEGAYQLTQRLDESIARGAVPVQYRVELSVARRDVDAIYFARRRYLQRVVDELDEVYEKGDPRDGVPRLTRRLLSPFDGNPEMFEAEVVLFIRALLVRARLAVLTAALLAMDGCPIDAVELVDVAQTETRADFLELMRRVVRLTDATSVSFHGRDSRS